MNVQEREELDYQPQSEALNCYQEARTEMSLANAKAQGDIDAHVRAGLYVVVGYFPWYCRATDAVVGEGRYLASSCLTRADAEAISLPCDEETRFKIFPKAAE